jgi:hypothetical protein
MFKSVFLGGTTGNDYRERITAALTGQGVHASKIFNPVVEHWDEAARNKEDAMKADPSVLMLFYLTANKGGAFDGAFLSAYSLQEAIMGLYDHPGRTVLVFDYDGMVPRAAKRLRKSYLDLKARFPTAPIFESLEEATEVIRPQL